jgi:putative effector of murein hydrolase LrgA (UPF0299 family)
MLGALTVLLLFQLAGEWPPILVAVVVCTALAIAVSALVMRALMRCPSEGNGKGGGA